MNLPLVGLERLLAGSVGRVGSVGSVGSVATGDLVRSEDWGRVGLLTNPSGVTRDLTPSAVALLQAGVDLVRLYGPEHGVDGSGAPGEAPGLAQDVASGLPATVLYHLTEAEYAERLNGVDTLLVDLVDVGVRFYTYISTIRDVLRASRNLPLRVVILDRPNPLGFTVEGPPLQAEFRSFVGITSSLPVRHGLTIGEVARVLADEEGVKVDVIETDAPDGWHAGRPWVPPSPNLPDLVNVRLYPGLGLVEALSASEGRGTALPFRQVGAPGLNAFQLARRLNGLGLSFMGFTARPAFFTPTTSKHSGVRCAGVQFHETDERQGTRDNAGQNTGPDVPAVQLTTEGQVKKVLPLGLAVFTALEQAGVERNPDWLQKLLGVPAASLPSTPELALTALQDWQNAGEQQALKLRRHWLYSR